jgi:hypothetical protein
LLNRRESLGGSQKLEDEHPHIFEDPDKTESSLAVDNLPET